MENPEIPDHKVLKVTLELTEPPEKMDLLEQMLFLERSQVKVLGASIVLRPLLDLQDPQVLVESVDTQESQAMMDLMEDSENLALLVPLEDLALQDPQEREVPLEVMEFSRTSLLPQAVVESLDLLENVDLKENPEEMETMENLVIKDIQETQEDQDPLE